MPQVTSLNVLFCVTKLQAKIQTKNLHFLLHMPKKNRKSLHLKKMKTVGV